MKRTLFCLLISLLVVSGALLFGRKILRLPTSVSSGATESSVGSGNRMKLNSHSRKKPIQTQASSTHEFMDSIESEKLRKNALFDRATKFEASLSKSDVLKITEGHPDSFFRFAGFFTTQAPLKGKCTREEYGRLKSKLPLEEIYTRGIVVIGLAKMYDDRHLHEYIEKIRSSWRDDSRWSEFSDLDAYYAEVDDLHELTRLSDKDYEERKARDERLLIRSGVSPGDLKNYVLRTAALSPPCLAQINMDFISRVKTEITVERGNSLLKALRDYWIKNHKVPSNFSKLSLSPGGPMFDVQQDGWKNDFKVKRDDSRQLFLYSPGEDGVSGTEDDVVIGSISV